MEKGYDLGIVVFERNASTEIPPVVLNTPSVDLTDLSPEAPAGLQAPPGNLTIIGCACLTTNIKTQHRGAAGVLLPASLQLTERCSFSPVCRCLQRAQKLCAVCCHVSHSRNLFAADWSAMQVRGYHHTGSHTIARADFRKRQFTARRCLQRAVAQKRLIQICSIASGGICICFGSSLKEQDPDLRFVKPQQGITVCCRRHDLLG